MFSGGLRRSNDTESQGTALHWPKSAGRRQPGCGHMDWQSPGKDSTILGHTEQIPDEVPKPLCHSSLPEGFWCDLSADLHLPLTKQHGQMDTRAQRGCNSTSELRCRFCLLVKSQSLFTPFCWNPITLHWHEGTQNQLVFIAQIKTDRARSRTQSRGSP